MSLETNTYQLFVYGSLRSGFHHPAYHYLSEFFRPLGDGLVKGCFFEKGDYPVAVPTMEERYLIGELYEANSPESFQWAIAQLDDYEGLNVIPGETPWYRRELVEVIQDRSQNKKAWIYWYNGSTEGLPALETGDIFVYLSQKNKS
ncbi:MAG: gamma-glutamylcyclotransferase [Ferruginibacter sp.]|nr:gamma-glutamylcyclotransferase [Ferruginibacter sp.]